ncbi:hypothetical protein BGZ97_005963, partial [Linnemannia gamsii]
MSSGKDVGSNSEHSSPIHAAPRNNNNSSNNSTPPPPPPRPVSAVPLAETLSANKDKDRVQQNKYDSLPTNIDRLELSSAGVGPADKVLDDVAV